MPTIVVKSQKEYDALVDFDEFTTIQIKSRKTTVIKIFSVPKNSHVEARESAHVVARGSAHVVARGSAHVVARENSTCVAFSVTRVSVHHFAVCILRSASANVSRQDDSAIIINRFDVFQHTKETFFEVYRENLQENGKVLLYKSTTEECLDFYSRTIKYEGIVSCPDWDPDPYRQCGGGLHLSPTPELAQSYNKGRTLKCLVHPDDFVVFGADISKVRCRKVEVLNDLA